MMARTAYLDNAAVYSSQRPVAVRSGDVQVEDPRDGTEDIFRARPPSYKESISRANSQQQLEYSGVGDAASGTAGYESLQGVDTFDGEKNVSEAEPQNVPIEQDCLEAEAGAAAQQSQDQTSIEDPWVEVEFNYDDFMNYDFGV